MKGIKVHDKNFCCWKLEATWDTAYFVRQKTYIEHIIAEDLEPIDKPYYSVKCAGMPEKCKQLFLRSMDGDIPDEKEELTDDERKFLSVNRKLSEFKVVLQVPSKLIPKRIKGGIVLVNSTFEMKEKI